MTLQAVRTVEETDDYRTIEGLAIPYGGPFNGKDTYGTYFSARSDLALDVPIKVWFNHGFDPDFGFSTIGKVTSVRAEEDGQWVQAQIDKRHRYYAERVAPLLDHEDGPQLGFSAGSAEHSYRVDPKSGEILTYPVHEISLTSTEANPWAAVAARSDDIIRVVDALRRDYDPDVGGGMDRDKIDAEDFAGPNRSFPIVTPEDVADAAASIGRAKGNKSQIRARIIAIAQRKGEAFAQKLPKEWSGAPEAERSGEPAAEPPFDRDAAHAALDAALDASADVDIEAIAGDAVRKGARNSQKDLTRINSIADHAAAIAQHAAALTKANDDPRDVPASPQSPTADDGDASRSGDPLPTVRIVERPETLDALRAGLLDEAKRIGKETARSMTGP